MSSAHLSSRFYLRYAGTNRTASADDYPETISALCIASKPSTAGLDLLVLVERREKKGEVRALTIPEASRATRASLTR